MNIVNEDYYISYNMIFEKFAQNYWNLVVKYNLKQMIEAWGRGFEKIKEACGLYDGPLPEYEINEAGIMVLCKACNKYLRLLAAKGKADSIISDERIMSEKMSELKKEPIVKIVNYLKDNKEITTAKGVELTGKSEAQVRRYLKALCNLGIIKSTRTTKGNVYVKV